MSLGDHYRVGIETWDYILSQGLGYLEGNVIKYVTRYKRKNGIEDLLKAQHYLTKLIEVTEKELNANTAEEEKSEVSWLNRIGAQNNSLSSERFKR